MKSMRALVASGVGHPSAVLRIESRPVPEPDRGQVRIRVLATPIHASDLHILGGRYGFIPPFPAVLGLECVGLVDALGQSVDDLTVGQRVITVGVTGSWQEYMIADATRVIPVADRLDISTAAQALINPITAVLLTTSELDIAPGEWLLQTAAGSTVGKMVVQLGNRLGFKTINVVRRRAGGAQILALGGAEVICTEDEDLQQRVAEIAGPRGVSSAIDCVAGQLGADVSRSLAPGGKLIVFGALSAHGQSDPNKLTLPLFSRSLIYETKSVRGFWLYRWFATTPREQAGAVIAKTLQLVSDGALRIPEGQLFEIEHFADAIALAAAPAHGAKPLFVFAR